VDEIEKYSFFEKGANIAGFRLRPVDGKWVAEFHGPSNEQLDAVLLHVRVLIRGDDISIGRMAELYDDPGVSAKWRDEHQHWRAQLNERLNWIAAEGDGRGVLTHRNVLDMFLYGRRGHFKEQDEAYRLYETWVIDEASREMLQDTFYQVVIWVLAIAHNLAVATREELARVRTHQHD